MERAARGTKDTRSSTNQPYDESSEVIDSEEVASVYSPTPCGGHSQSDSRRTRKGRGSMSANSGSDEFDEDHKPSRASEQSGVQPGVNPHEEDEEEEDDEDEEEEEEDSDEDDSDDDDEPSKAPEGAYDPADYANSPVSTEIKESFQYITRYTPPSIESEHSSKPFIPDFIPAVGDIDAFSKVPRPDGKGDSSGSSVSDEPSVKQADPTVSSSWSSEETKQHGATELKKVTSVASPQTNPRAVDSWVESISASHRSKPPASVQYGRAMPDIDSSMQEWPAESEESSGRSQSPPARSQCSSGQYTDIICSSSDIPVYNSRIQSSHSSFSLYSEFRDSQHFTRRA